jgi:hypothetical protein
MYDFTMSPLRHATVARWDIPSSILLSICRASVAWWLDPLQAMASLFWGLQFFHVEVFGFWRRRSAPVFNPYAKEIIPNSGMISSTAAWLYNSANTSPTHLIPEEVGSMFLRNVGSNYKASWCHTPECHSLNDCCNGNLKTYSLILYESRY